VGAEVAAGVEGAEAVGGVGVVGGVEAAPAAPAPGGGALAGGRPGLTGALWPASPFYGPKRRLDRGRQSGVRKLEALARGGCVPRSPIKPNRD